MAAPFLMYTPQSGGRGDGGGGELYPLVYMRAKCKLLKQGGFSY